MPFQTLCQAKFAKLCTFLYFFSECQNAISSHSSARYLIKSKNFAIEHVNIRLLPRLYSRGLSSSGDGDDIFEDTHTTKSSSPQPLTNFTLKHVRIRLFRRLYCKGAKFLRLGMQYSPSLTAI